MDLHKKRCPHGEAPGEDCARCDREEAVRAKILKREAKHDPEAPDRILAAMREAWDKAHGKGKLQDHPTVILRPAPIEPRSATEKVETRKQTRPFPRVLSPPKPEPAPEPTGPECIVPNCTNVSVWEGLCGGCKAACRLWHNYNKQPDRCPMLLSGAQVSIFRKHFSDKIPDYHYS